ncbi:uncharacterized protein LOC132752992 [Ruditapes philippinarum]|uniref:uncharacterized protein LOC132752992 n=1 Tax=Ruditapes philippinarum TaxID=129788 RepID=UPI00295B4B2A|nr:uncharacterized protein LOC132752992 [Ruditapes philippinarum]
MGWVKFNLSLSIFFNAVALVAGAMALGLPLWVIIEKDEGMLVANGTRKINAGLFLKSEVVQLKVNNLTHAQWDDESWRSHTGRTFDEDDMTAVKATLITGLIFVILSLFTSIIVCCCYKKKQYRRFMIISFGTIVATIIAVILITTGPIVYVTKIVKDYDRKILYVGFWMCVTSSVSAGISACFSIATFLLYRQKKRGSSRGHTSHGMPNNAFN